MLLLDEERNVDLIKETSSSHNIFCTGRVTQKVLLFLSPLMFLSFLLGIRTNIQNHPPSFIIHCLNFHSTSITTAVFQTCTPPSPASCSLFNYAVYPQVQDFPVLYTSVILSLSFISPP